MAMMNDNNVGSINSEYCYDFSKGKDCYLVSETIDGEKCYYSTDVCSAKNMVDCITVYESNFCYECTDSYGLYDCIYTQNSSDSSGLMLAYDCKNCQDCIASIGLRNQKYCIRNKQYEKEEFLARKEERRTRLYNEKEILLGEWNKFLNTQARKYANFVNTTDCVGNNLFNCQNMLGCFDMKESKNCKYFYLSAGAQNCMDITISVPKERCYESLVPDFGRNVAFTIFCRRCTDVRYSEMCHRCKNCFGCV